MEKNSERSFLVKEWSGKLWRVINKPNFFIVGAPKAGTTALFKYLRRHPNVFMPVHKEPHYFAKDFPDYPSFKTEQEYFALFNRVTSKHLAVGEASVWYLYSDVALELIYRYDSESKIIVMLRNPIDLAYSMHNQALYNFNEEERDFEKAWFLQKSRAEGQQIPQGCRAVQILQYKKLASLGYQVRRLYRIFPPECILLIFYEDFVSDTLIVYNKVLSFLGVQEVQEEKFGRVNESMTHRFELLGRMTQVPPKLILHTVRFLRKRFGIEIAKPLRWVRRLNEKTQVRRPMRKGFKEHLIREFEADIHLLEKLTDRDLSSWER